MKYILLALATAIFAGQATAREISVTARCVEHAQFDNEYEFVVVYKDAFLPTDTTLTLSYGYRQWGNNSDEPDGGSYFHWQNPNNVAVTEIAQGHYQSRHTLREFTGTGGWSEYLQFAFAIRKPDGTIVWDNNGHPWGYYEAYFHGSLRCTDLAIPKIVFNAR